MNINFQQRNVSKMSFNANLFKFIICVLAFKNFKEKSPYKALQEIHRVLKPGGTARYGLEQASNNEGNNVGLKD